MATGRSLVIPSIALAAALLVAACSETTKHRVLTFFFDGVPEPGAERAAEAEAGEMAPQEAPAERAARKRVSHAHPPFRDNRCDACHDPDSAQLIKTAQRGLCRTCHPDVPGEVVYVHGPVVVRDCLYCHHHHGSQYPGILLEDPMTICFRCHRRADLTEGEHHAMIEDQRCTDCHDPHGADNRYFLKRIER